MRSGDSGLMASARIWATPRVSSAARIVGFDVDGAVGALGEGLAQGGLDALGAGADDDDFAGAVLLFELQGLFEGVGVGLVDGVVEVGLVDPLAIGGDVDGSVALGDLLDGYDDLQLRSS